MQTKPSPIPVGNLFERWKFNNLSVVHRRLGYESMVPENLIRLTFWFIYEILLRIHASFAPSLHALNNFYVFLFSANARNLSPVNINILKTVNILKTWRVQP